MKVLRTERHIIKSNNTYYNMIKDYCKISKDLYNQANYIIRQEFCKNHQWIRYNNDLIKKLRENEEFNNVDKLPCVQCAQQILKILDKNWSSFFKSIRDWTKNKNKYKGQPKLPKYKDKNGYNLLIFTNQNCKIKNGFIHFPKKLNRFKLKTKVNNLQQVRILPNSNHLVIEIIYYKEINNAKEINSNRIISIDLGLNNFATIANNCNLQTFIINGKGLKSMNKYWNKLYAHYKSVLENINKKKSSKRLKTLTFKRNNKMNDFCHKASKYIITYCVNHDIDTIVLGKNNSWKDSSKMSKLVNQTFIQFPYQNFIDKLEYKCFENNIKLILTEESYTSKTSFLDKELPQKHEKYIGNRIKRGLFSNGKNLINADLNGAFQIMRKVFDEVEIPVNRGFVFNPIKVNVV